MRTSHALAAAAGLLAGLALLAPTDRATLAQDPAAETERFVLFETFGDTG